MIGGLKELPVDPDLLLIFQFEGVHDHLCPILVCSIWNENSCMPDVPPPQMIILWSAIAFQWYMPLEMLNLHITHSRSAPPHLYRFGVGVGDIHDMFEETPLSSMPFTLLLGLKY